MVVAQHQRNKLVADALISRGVPHFIPMLEVLTIVRGRHERAYRPLLKEYILFAMYSGWKELLSVRGVAGMLFNCDGWPAQVLPVEVERLQAMCPDGIATTEAAVVLGFHYGQKVSPKEGLFAGHVGRYFGEAKDGKDIALFALFGRESKAFFGKGDLLAV